MRYGTQGWPAVTEVQSHSKSLPATVMAVFDMTEFPGGSGSHDNGLPPKLCPCGKRSVWRVHLVCMRDAFCLLPFTQPFEGGRHSLLILGNWSPPTPNTKDSLLSLQGRPLAQGHEGKRALQGHHFCSRRLESPKSLSFNWFCSLARIGLEQRR